MAFSVGTNLTEINVDEGNSKYCSEDGILFNKDKTEIIYYPVGKTETSYTIPDGVVNISNGAFYGCYKLTSIIIPNGVENIGDEAFYNCNKLTSIAIPETVTSIGDMVFCLGKNLTEINVDESNSKYCSEDGILFNKDKTEIICYPAGKTETSYTIPDSVTKIENGAFSDCSNLTSIEFPEGLISIGDYAFEDCEGLISIELPESLVSIGNFAFMGCSNLISIELPEGLTTIGKLAFSACYSLETIKIPKGVTKIEQSTFSHCESLRLIQIPSTVTKIYNNAITYTNNAMIIAEKGSAANEYAIKYQFERITYNVIDWTNGIVELELNDELYKTTTIDENGTIEIEYTYIDQEDETEHTEKVIVEIPVNEVETSTVGDVNNDGKIDLTDLLVLKRHLVAGSKTEWKLTGENLVLADINKDGKVDITDIVLLKRHLVAGNNEAWKIK
jgi:hypothetical protein